MPIDMEDFADGFDYTDSDLFEPELGQMAFGNDFYPYACNDAVDSFLETLSFLLDIETYYLEFENDTFVLRPYYWGDDEEKSKLPNFHHKESNYSVCWYKHIGRGMSQNKKIKDEELVSIMKSCFNSLK